MTYGIVGVGAIAAAIVTGLYEDASGAPSIVLSPRNAGRAANLAARFPTVRVARSNQEVIDAAEVILLCIRPQDARAALPGLKFSAQHAIVSMLAGISIDALAELVAPAQNIARAIPLPSVSARRGSTPIFPPTQAARELFDRLGRSIEIPTAVAFEATSASTATVAAHRRAGSAAARSGAGLRNARARPRDSRRHQRAVPGRAGTGTRIRRRRRRAEPRSRAVD